MNTYLFVSLYQISIVEATDIEEAFDKCEVSNVSLFMKVADTSILVKIKRST